MPGCPLLISRAPGSTPGPHTFPDGLLVLQARFIPAFVGVLLIIGFFGYLMDFVTRLLFPDYMAILPPIAGASKFGELAMILWLLIKGVTPPQELRPET